MSHWMRCVVPGAFARDDDALNLMIGLFTPWLRRRIGLIK
jgi:hypothetical protein